MEKIKLLWFTVFSENMVRMIKELTPEEIEPLFVHSAEDKEEHLRLLAQADYIAPNNLPLTEEYLRAAKKVKLIQTWGAGVDKYDKKLLSQLNIALQNGGGFNAAAVSEMAVLLMLAVNRQLVCVDRSLRARKWHKNEMRDQNYSLYGKSVGIVGMGSIGRKVVGMLRGFNVKEILYYDAFRLPAEREEELGVTYCHLDELMGRADIVSLHAPLLDSTRKMISKELLDLMKPDAILINVARGGLVDEEALAEALRNHKIRGAGLDTFAPEPPAADNPLFELDNVVLTCHIAGAVKENIPVRIRHVYDCVMKFERGEPVDPKYIVLTRKGE